MTVGNDDAAIAVENLFISFRIRKELSGTPASGVVEITNLTRDNERQIRERGVRLLIEAGYQDELLQVFDGIVRRVERIRNERDRVLRIHVGSKIAAVQTQTAPGRAVISRTWAGTVKIRDIVVAGIEAMELDVGNLDAIPDTATETDFQYTGSARLMVQQRLAGLEPPLQFYEEDGVVNVGGIRRSKDDRDRPDGVLISQRTGMIRTPEITEDGLRVSTILNPNIQLDARVRVESSFAGEESTDTVWKAVVITHSGDNWTGTFATHVECRPVG